ncbi:hypothetical protein [Pedobacter sp. WC2423]|uniref:hypothetical protein n=1 Tax=Pedobacter sp. WC2423 TaxID=3234142 RepID=UPI003465C8B0
MIFKNSKYNCFTEKGQSDLPDNEFIKDCFQKGIEPVIYLDSCVCLHIIRVIDHRRSAENVDFSKIIALKEYIDKHPDIKISPFFAFLELCTKNGAIDKEKFQDFKLRIDFFEQIPLKVFRKFKYDFHRDIFVFRNIADILGNPLEVVDQVVNNSYCTLLKVRSLALNGLTKNMAEDNLSLLTDWMINSLNIFRGSEYKLAMHIFGGNTEFRKMIGMDSKGANVKKKLIGTAWDMFHTKFTANSFRLSEILQRNIYSFFLTSDNNLFKIFENLSLEVIKDGGDDFVSSFIMTSDFSYPHLDESFIDRNNEKLFEIFLDRRNQQYIYDKVKVDKMIAELEFENGIN